MMVGDPHWFPVRFIFFKNFSRSNQQARPDHIQGGAIAYFGEVGVMEPQMAAELETYMLTDYVGGQRGLGAIYLQAEREYWKHHIDDPGIVDHHSPSRLYLGFMVMFGDPSLRVHWRFQVPNASQTTNPPAAGKIIAGLSETARSKLASAVQAILPIAADGSIHVPPASDHRPPRRRGRPRPPGARRNW